MIKKIYFAFIIFCLILTTLFTQEQKEEIEKKEQSITSVKKNLNEQLKIIRKEISDLNKEKINLKKEYYNILKKIKNIEKQLIETLDNNKIKELKIQKDEALLKKVEIEQRLIEIDSIVKENKNEIKKLKEEKDFIIADGTLNWAQTYDIKNYRKGKWHIEVKAKDNHQNWSEIEKINIKIDPKSDIPRVSIINPTKGQRVTSILKIVGTAYDDDAIEKVTLQIDNVKDEIECIGKEFWYYDLNTSILDEGMHNITVKAYDIKGVPSKPSTRYFNVDKNPPSITIKSKPEEITLSGKIKIKGTAIDGNGINNIEYSTDNRKTFKAVDKIQILDRNKKSIAWEINIDSEKLVDGMQTIWLRASDNAGSTTYESFTYLIDHKKPVIDIQYPSENEKLNGKITVFGYVYDNVGIKKTTIEIKGGNAPKNLQEITLRPGNAFWAHDIDLTGLKDGSYQIIASVTDVANNIVRKIVNINIVNDEDKANINFTSFKPGEKFSSTLPLFGKVIDDDGGKEILLKIFKKNTLVYEDKITVDLNGGFLKNLDLTNYSIFEEGEYSLELLPFDINEKAGNAYKTKFFIDRSYPKFDLESINKWAGKSFNKISLPGFNVIKFGEIKNISFSILNKNNEEIIKQKELKFKKGKTEGIYEVDPVILDPKEKINETGLISVKLIATDSADNSTTLIVPFIYDNIPPAISLPTIDQTIGMTKNEEISVNDNLILEKIKINITSTDKSFTPIAEEIIDNEKIYTLNVKDNTNKFVEYQLSIEAIDKAGNINKVTQKINFKQTTEPSHTLTIKITRNNNIIYSNSPILFVEDKNFGLEKYNSSYYLFLPQTFNEAFIEAKNLNKNFSPVDESNGIYIMNITNEEKLSLEKGAIDVKNVFKIENKKETINLIYLNDVSNPVAEVLYPSSYMVFNKDFQVYMKANDDSETVEVFYITDDIIPRNISIQDFESNILNKIKDPEERKILLALFNKTQQGYILKEKVKAEDLITILNIFEKAEKNVEYATVKAENIEKINTIKVPSLNPLKSIEMQTLTEFTTSKNVIVKSNDRLFGLKVSLENLLDGEHIIKFKIVDKSGKTTFVYYPFIVDKKEPEIELWALNPIKFLESKKTKKQSTVLPVEEKKKISNKKQKVEEKENVTEESLEQNSKIEKEKMNGLITLRGKAKDETNLFGVVILYNGNEVIAKGKSYWENLYDLTRVKNVELKEGEKNHIIELFAIDLAGNKKIIQKPIIIAEEEDMPVVFINKPAIDGERFGIDTNLTGIAFDDDGVDYLEYRIKKSENEEREWKKIEVDKISGKWNILIPSGELVSSIYYLEVRAIDLYGLKSEIKKIKFHVDKENPIVTINSPLTGSYLKGNVVLNGTAEDPNGIETVEISINNGWSFVKCEGKENWKYNFDTKTVPDGQLRVLIKTKDKAGSEGFSFALFNIDNTSPEVDILLPKDGSSINNKYKIIGRAKDNLAIEDVRIKIAIGDKNMLRNVDKDGFTQVNGKEAWFYEIETQTWEINKTYTIIVKVIDKAGNVVEKSVLFTVDPKSDLPVVDLIQPQESQYMTGEVLYFFGNAYDDDAIDAVFIRIDDGEAKQAKGTTTWYYTLPTVNLSPGKHKIEVYAKEKNPEGKEILSEKIIRYFYFMERGPIVKVKSHVNGAPVGHRPWLLGEAEFYEKDLDLKLKKEIQEMKLEKLKKKFRRTPELIPSLEKISVKKGEVDSLKRKFYKNNKIDSVILTFDNGKRYFKNYYNASKWKIRLQTQYLTNGEHMLQIKTVTQSGVENLEFFKIIIDRNKPSVIIDKPVENMEVNEKVVITGSTNDNGLIEEVKVALKPFDKNLGKIPKFVQGIYLWAQAFGGPWVSGGFGLTFFEDIVRLEGVFGWVPTYENIREMGYDPENVPAGLLRTNPNSTEYTPRFSGFVTGGKLLARVIDIPFEFFFGEDARNFSISAEIGAGFFWYSGFGAANNEINNTYYNLKRPDEKDGYQPMKDGKVVAGFMYQIDFFKVERYGMFRKFALYFEQGFYFIASEIEGGLIPQIGFGIRNALL